jgi:glycosyltransferase involved in cell wall biosynthesis
MKILLINPGLSHSQPQLRYMVQAGHDVHCLNVAGGYQACQGVTAYDWSNGRITAWSKLNYFRFGFRARKFIDDLKPDIVHAHFASSAGLVAYLSGFHPYAVTIHGSDLIYRAKTALGRSILRRVLCNAQLVNPVAGHMLPLIYKLGVLAERVLVLPFGIELEQYPYRPADQLLDNAIRVLCTRSLNADVYDIPTLLRGVAHARRRGGNVMLTLAATGRLSAKMKALASELGIEKYVTFGQGYAMSDLPEIMSRHDVYVSTSRWDGASLSLMETMACGLFPMVTNIQANTEWVDSSSAMLFEAGNYEQLGELLLGLPGQKAFVGMAIAKNRLIAQERADRTKLLAQLVQKLEAVVLSSRNADK